MNAKRHVYDLNRVKLWDNIPLRTPYHISIEATFKCNIRCNYCIHAMDASEIKRRGYHFSDMPWTVFENIVEQISGFEDKVKVVVFSGLGEPLVNKRLPEMVRRIKDTGHVDKILLITNGLLLTPQVADALIEAGLDECKISLQGMTADAYKTICGVDIDWSDFYNNLVYFSENKGKCLLKAKIGDTSLSGDDERKFYDTFGQICDYVDIEHIYPQFDGVDYSKSVLQDEGKNRFWHDLKQLNVCSPLFFRLYVLQDGRVTFAYPDGITFEGFNVCETTLKKIWSSEEAKSLWINALNHKFPVCLKCKRWSYSAHPDDIVDGYEPEILRRIQATREGAGTRAIQVLCAEDQMC